MTLTHASKMEEINRNAVRFDELLPGLLAEHRGQYALMRDRQILDYYPTALDAQMAGNAGYQDGMFSVQRVTDEVEQLGRYAYALRKR